MVSIILLAMVALFVGLRLYSVLGRRTGHEQPIAKPVEGKAPLTVPARRTADVPAETPLSVDPTVEPRAQDGVRAIVAADPSFDPGHFVDGAKSAYRMVLEAYWSGDEAALAQLADEEVREAFGRAIADRAAAGHRLENRLIAIERAVITRARLDGQAAVVTVLFDADIATIIRDAEDEVVGGSLSDAVSTHDVWTFSRQVRADDPNWILIETDEAA